MASQKYTVDQVRDAIRDSRSWRQTAYRLGLNGDGGGNTKTLRQMAEANGIDYSHFTGRGSNKNASPWNYVPVDKWLKNGIIVKSTYLKKKLIDAGLIEDICVECGIGPEWNGRTLKLELDHVDGNNRNNEISNLRILCPNCHSQTPTFRGRKK